MNKFKTALIGAGEVAQNFHLPLLRSMPNVDLVALGDRTIGKGRAVAQKFSIPFVTTRIEDICERSDIDTVILTTPTDLHYNQAEMILESGKHLLIEKPVASGYQQAMILAELAAKKGVKVMVGMNHRFRSDAKMMKNYVANGDLGQVYYIKAGWMQKKEGIKWQKKIEDGNRPGVLTDLGLSLIDSVLWLMDFKEVASVHASNFHRISNDYEDIAVVRISFTNGSVAVIECSWAIYSGETSYFCNAYGNLGSASVNPFRLNTSSGDIMKEGGSADKKSNAIVHRKSYESELKHFFYAVGGHLPVISTIEEAAISLKILEALYTSAKTDREVVVVY